MLSPTEEIKAKLDIVDVIQEYFPLRQAGVNMKARCPFHEEKTPSFMVNREKQFFHCFGCNESGDIFTFLQKMENIEFPEALRILAKKAGVKLPEYDPKISNLKTRLIDIQLEAARFFYGQLKNSEAGKRALSYLKEKRNLTDETIEEWKLGYALDSWEAVSKYLQSKKFMSEEILQSGLVVQKNNKSAYAKATAGNEFYDRFRDRVMFPIDDYHGNIVGFTGRTMKEDEPAKYVNSPQTLIYNKSEVIFGLYRAKQMIKEKDKVVIVEGNMDVITSHQAGIKNVVAVSGTALTESQIKILQRYTNNFVFCFDADAAGVRAAERSITLAWQAEVSVRVIRIDEKTGKDPDEVIRKDPKIWQELIDKAPLAMDYFFEVNLKEYEPENVESKKQVAKNLLNYIIKLASSIEQDFYTKKLAEAINVEESALREAIEKAIKSVHAKDKWGGRQEQANKQENAGGIESSRDKVNKKVLVGERLLAYLFMGDDYVEYIGENLLLEDLPEQLRNIYKLIIVYYTREYSQDVNLFDFIVASDAGLTSQANKMLILAEEELAKMRSGEVMAEIKRGINYLKNERVRQSLSKLEGELKQAENELKVASNEERDQKKEQVEALLQEFSKLSVELKEANF